MSRTVVDALSEVVGFDMSAFGCLFGNILLKHRRSRRAMGRFRCLVIRPRGFDVEQGI